MTRILNRTSLLLLLIVLQACATGPAPSRLYVAAAEGTLDEVEQLLAAGADPNQIGGFWDRPLPAAFANRDLTDPDFLPIVQALLDGGADPNGISHKESNDVVIDQRPILWAVQWDKFACDQTLLSLLVNAGADINIHEHGQTALFWAAASGRDLECAERLIDFGAQITGRSAPAPEWFGASSDIEQIQLAGWDLSELRARVQAVAARAEKAKRDELAAAERAKAQALIAAETRKFELAWDRDQSLPSGVRRDKYLVAFSNAMKSGNYEDADFYARLLERNNTAIEPSLYYFWGDALLKLKRIDEGLSKLNTYLALTGSAGTYYAETLALMVDAENR